MQYRLPSGLKGTSLCDQNPRVFERDNYTCVYCGYDGRCFPNWMQLTVDHVRPTNQGGSNTDDNKVTCCSACNSMTGNVLELTFPPEFTREQIMQRKLDYIKRSRTQYFGFWIERVAHTTMMR